MTDRAVVFLILSFVSTSVLCAPPENVLRLSIGGFNGNPEITYGGQTDEIDPDAGDEYAIAYWNLYEASRAADLYLGIEWLQQHKGEYFDGAASFTTNLDAVMLNAIYKGDAFYMGAGVGLADVELSDMTGVILNATSLAASGTHDDEEFAWQIVLGYDKPVGNAASIGIMYRYLHTEPQFKNLTLGTLDASFDNSSLSVTLSLGF